MNHKTPKYVTKTAYTIKDMYESYVDYTGENNLSPIGYVTFKLIILDHFEYIKAKLFNGMEYEMPYRLGILNIMKSKTRGRSVDFGATRKAGYTIWYTNDHSNGYKYRLHWNTNAALTNDIKKYRINFTRYNKRGLAKLIKDQQKDFIEW